MTSPGLKRPLEFELVPHTSGTSWPVANGGNKRRCTNFTPQSKVDTSGGHNNSPFKDSSSILTPLNEDIASMIKDEIHRAHGNHSKGNEVLTVRQTQIICEKLIKDREQKLKEEYDRILESKLAEQYDTFVKYTHDHLSHQASYLS